MSARALVSSRNVREPSGLGGRAPPPRRETRGRPPAARAGSRVVLTGGRLEGGRRGDSLRAGKDDREATRRERRKRAVGGSGL